jgi:hypothetical protein
MHNYPRTCLTAANPAAVLQVPGWLFQAAISRTASVPALLQLLESPAAAAAADLACIVAALRHLLDLQQQQQQPVGSLQVQSSGSSKAPKQQQQQQQQQQVEAAGDPKAVEKQVRQCCQLVSALAAQLPAVKQQQQKQQQQQQQQQEDSSCRQAADAATIVWATAQLQHKDSQLSGSCLQLFAAAAGAGAASQADAAAVVTAMVAAGRALPKVFSGCSRELLQQVLQQCTAKLLGDAPQAVASEQQVHSRNSSSGKRRKRTTSQQLSSNASSPTNQQSNLNPEPLGLQPADPESLLLAQRLLQLHAVLQVPPGPVHLQQLLAAAADEEALAAMKDNAATAALVASLAAVAELSRLRPTAEQTAAAAVKHPQQKKRMATKESEFGVWGPQQQVQQLLQQLLLDGLLPRLSRATAKQVATTLEAAAELADEQAVQSVLLLWLECPLARDFARGVFKELLTPQMAAADAPPAAAAAVSDDPDMRSQWNQSPAAAGAAADATSFLNGWKGEHVAAVAVAALQLGVAHPPFLEAVAADILLAAPAASTAPAAVQAAGDGASPEQQQQQRRRSRLEKVTPQHLVQICCCAAALNCRVDQLLEHTVSLAAKELKASAAQVQQQTQRKQGQQKGPLQQQLGAIELLLLAWCVAEVDVPQLLQPAAELAAAGVAALQAAAGPSCLQQHRSGVAARLFQLHVWLSDRQMQLEQEQQLPAAGSTSALPAQPASPTTSATAAASISSSSSGEAVASMSEPIGLAGVLAADQLQQACSAWQQLQTAAPGVDRRLAAVAGALQQLPGLELMQQQSTSSDGWLVIDVEARVQGIPVAVLLLDDSDEPLEQQEQQQQGSQAQLPGLHSTSSSSSSSASRLQDCLRASNTGDLMFRARALAARGYWVVVVSWQQWLLLDGFLDAEVNYLQSKLWLLEGGGGGNFGVNTGANFSGSLSSGDAGVSSGMPVTAAAASSEAAQEDE